MVLLNITYHNHNVIIKIFDKKCIDHQLRPSVRIIQGFKVYPYVCLLYPLSSLPLLYFLILHPPPSHFFSHSVLSPFSPLHSLSLPALSLSLF